MADIDFLGLTTCPHHASGNVGDQLITKASIKILKNNLDKKIKFNVHFRKEEFSSRIEYLNNHDAIILFGFPILESDTRPRRYRIAENLDNVDPPIIPIGAIHKFFPGTEEELGKRVLQSSTRSFLDRVVANCSDGKVPVRTDWVGQVLRQNGYDTILTGDPAWYDPETVGREFHKPETINRLIFTPPHSRLYVEQARELLNRLGDRYKEADRRMVLQSAPMDVDRELYEPAREAGFKIYYASHDTTNLEIYRESDLHVGYRKHGHLAHLRWRRPSVVLAEDSRAAGLNSTLGAAGVRAYSSKPASVLGYLGSVGDLLEKAGSAIAGPTYQDRKALDGRPNPDAVDEVFDFLESQDKKQWNSFDRIGEKIDKAYENGMKKYIKVNLK